MTGAGCGWAFRTGALAALILAALPGSGRPAHADERSGDNPLYGFFPFGAYLVGPDPVSGLEGDLARKADATCADLKAHAFDCVWANNLDLGRQGEAWLAAGAKHGVRIILQGGGAPDLLRLEPPYTPAGMFEDREYLDRVVLPHWTGLASRYRSSPALLAYALDEECPPSPAARYAVLDRVTRLVGALDPAHPAIVMYNQATSAELAADLLKPKAIAADWYPFFADSSSGPHTRGGSLSFYLINQERAYRAARRSGGPLWIVAQAEATDRLVKGGPDRPLYRMPGPNEMRWQVWCSLFCGAKGLFFYVYSTGSFARPEFAADAATGTEIYWERGLVDPQGRESRIYREAAQVSREIDPLKPLFLKLEQAAPEQNVLYWIESQDILGRTFVHRDTGARYLVLFNADSGQAHPAGVELNRFAQAVSPEAGTYDVRGRRQLSSAWPDRELKELMIGPGDGAVVLILDRPEALARHQEQYER